MKTILETRAARRTAACSTVILVAALACARPAEHDVAAYVWPAYQNEPRWAELGIFGDGKGEWQNLYEAVKRRKDDCWGVRPLWGYEDEADPVVVARKIDAATAAGVNVFIYDWYWYGGRPFLEAALDKGFLGAPNSARMKFFIMYANHDVKGSWNNKLSTKDGKEKVIWPAKISDSDWREIVDRWVSRYFSRPNYYRIDGKPLVSIYQLDGFVRWDGLAKAKERIDYLRARVKEAGLPGLHLQTVGCLDKPEMHEAFAVLGVESATVYNWCTGTYDRMNDKSKPELSYVEWGELALATQKVYAADMKKRGITFFPNLTIGWDMNARCPPEETRRIVRGSNPVDFERFAGKVKAWSDAGVSAPGPKLITVNAWNEWTENSHLEPDDRFGYGYLNALWKVFGK